jgi:hypothetical protein
MRWSAAIVTATFLAACGGRGLAPADGSADHPDALRADAPRDAAAEAGSDGAPRCVPACGAGKVCTDGACVPVPVVLALAPGCGAARLTRGAYDLFWTERATGLVKTVPMTGNAAGPTVVASLQPGPGPITADDKAVYWSNEGDRTIRSVPLPIAGSGAPDGGAPVLLTAAAPVSALVAGYGLLFYSAGASTYQLPQNGAPILLGSFAACRPSTAGALALSDSWVFQTADQLQFIVRVLMGGTQVANDPCVAADAGASQIPVPLTVTHTQGGLLLDTLQVDLEQVVWADHGYITARTIYINGEPNHEVALSAGSNSITGFIVVGDRIFLAEGDDPGGGPTAHTIQSAPYGGHVDGGQAPTATVIATNQPGARSFVTDDGTHVYWVTHTPSATPGAPADCAIVSLSTK